MWYLIVSIPDLCNLTYFEAVGETRDVTKWFRSYLSDRQQQVVITGVSLFGTIRAGVPQGSILGPLLILLFINDIVNALTRTYVYSQMTLVSLSS